MTAAPFPSPGAGLPVAVGQIDRELKKLWDQNGSFATRASLINLAIYCEGEEAMQRNTELISRITQSHACRALLICVRPNEPEANVQAWISAHCHVTRAGGKQTCCEQLTFLLDGPSSNLIPNIVFSHLDSDLPLYLWWQGEFPDPLDSQLWGWVDRLIYDSNDWRDRQAELKQLRASLAEGKRRITLCDLNWTRTIYYRQALSLTFDHPAHLPHLQQLSEVELVYAPGYLSTAQLLGSWLAAQLHYHSPAKNADGTTIEFRNPEAEPVVFRFREAPGASVSGFNLRTKAGASFRFTREEGSDFLHADIDLTDGRAFRNLFPAGRDTLDAIINEELQRGGLHRVYLKALSIAEGLF